MTAPKTIMAGRFFFVSILLLFCSNIYGQAGKDGVRIINSANTVVNDYTLLQIDASSGVTSITVLNNSLTSSFASSLNSGDLIYIIQMQGASINTSDDSSYGSIINYGNCGNNEFAEVTSVSGTTTININCALQNSYSAIGKVLIVRVPRLNTLTINGGGSVTCPAWNGSTGGIVAIEVLGSTIVNAGGSIDVSGKGFRGGSLFDNNAAYGVLNFRWPLNDYGAEKGEGIAGSTLTYDLLGGRYCKGAPANGGGGGSSHNCGGGGGANAGNISQYTGRGNPDITNASWAAAWNLEYTGFSSSVSSGGGKGGYSFSDNDQNALAVGPFNAAWGGDARRNNGGLGGHPLDYSSGKIFMGGGGGAGDQNNSRGGIGGIGGGIITILSYSTISGSGQILANGANGASTLTTNGTDGAGGGGAGGSVILNTTGAASGITINANGGNGGSQSVLIFTDEAEGPGGGGGGGYIAIANGTISKTATGGSNGVTNCSSLSEFPPNGATKGGIGINNATVNTFRIITQTQNICGSSSVTLTFSTTGSPPPGIIYSWYEQPVGGTALGTGTSFTTPVLTAPKTYYVSSCPGTIRVPIQVNVSSNLSPAFNSVPVCAGSPMNFSATGSAAVSSWIWNFGDGTGVSNQQNPSYTYSNGGSYTVTLTASDGICSSSVSQTVTVNNAPTASFTSSAPASGCGPFNVQFTNNTVNATGYTWNFGDGSSTSSLTNPAHTYSSTGTYTVILTATGSGCTRTTSLGISVGPPPTASFIANYIACQNDTIYFTNQSVGNGSAITSLNWNFGDGSPPTSNSNPFHVYSGSGTFNVILTVITALCSDDTTISITVNPAASAGFIASASFGCTPLGINFTNNSTGAVTYNWNFGDGSTSSSQTNPSHIYSAPGVYSVTLIASQGICSDTISMQNMIQVTNAPHASFTSQNAICLGDNLSFSNLSVGNGSTITAYTWNFGDGTPASSQQNPSHSFLVPGIYQVKLTVSAGGCNDDTTISVNVSPGPIASFNIPVSSGCGSLLASFNNSTTGSPSFTWNFGDGSPLSNQVSPSHFYSSPGTFDVTLIAVQGSCTDTLQQINLIEIENLPTSSFSASGVCEGDSARFINLSSGNGSPLTTFNWTLGDGNTSTGSSPSHLYAASGSYSVRLTVSTSNNCSDDTTITINVTPSPAINFSSSVTTACDSATVSFINSSTGANSFSWTFGDGGLSASASPVHTYNAVGSYSVMLTASSSGGCNTSRSIFNMISIYPTPVASISASAQNICKNDCIIFNGQTSPDATSWNWTFAGANPSTAAVQQPGNICYPSTASYDVTLQVSNGHCTATYIESAYIHVVECSAKPIANLVSGDSLFCSGSCIDFVDLSTNATSWQWTFPGAIPSNSTIEHPTNICYPNAGTYSVSLIAGNAAGYDTITYSNLLQVNPSPVAPTFTQNGDSLLSSVAQQYQWYYNNISISGATLQFYLALISGPYSVTVTDVNGCTASSAAKYVSLVGIEEIRSHFIFYIFPNPVQDELSVLMQSESLLNLTVSVYDVIGQKMMLDHFSMTSSEEIFRLNLRKLAGGMYFLHIEADGLRWIRPFFKH